MKSLLLFLLIVSTTLHSTAQTTAFNHGFQFSAGTQVGLLRGKSELKIGDKNFNVLLSPLNEYQFRLRYRFNDRLFTSLGYNVGFATGRYQYPMDEFTMGFMNFYHRADLSTGFSVLSTPKQAINILAGVGIEKYAEGSGYNQGSGENYWGYMNYYSSLVYHFNVQTGVAYVFKTKHQNELALSLIYHREFYPLVSGYWAYFEYNSSLTSQGIFNQYNSGLRLGLEYTFTRARKKEMYSKAMKDGVSKRAYNKQKRFENRFIDPKGLNIGGGIGATFLKNKVQDQDPYFSNTYAASFLPTVYLEKGWKNLIFIEASYQTIELGIKNQLSYNGVRGSSGFYGGNYQVFTFGANYKAQLPKNRLQLVNVHGGFGIGFYPRNYDKTGVYSNINDIIQKYDTVTQLSKTMVFAYLGLSKDFRLTKQLSVRAQYQLMLGLNPILQVESNYQLPYSTTMNTSRGVANGSGHQFHIGLTYKLPSFKKE